MSLKHYPDRGVSKAELSRRFGVNRRTIHYRIQPGRLDRDLSAGARCDRPTPGRRHGQPAGREKPVAAEATQAKETLRAS